VAKAPHAFLFFYFFIFNNRYNTKEKSVNHTKLSLLQCVSCLNPAKSFAAFVVNKLLRIIEFYPNDLIDVPEVALRYQFKNYVTNVRSGL